MSSEERDRLAELRDAYDRGDDDGTIGSDAMLLSTFEEDTYPADAMAVYACHPASIDCDEEEGATAVIPFDSDQIIYALNVGSEVPPIGTLVIGHVCGGRWVFDWSTPA